MDKGDLMRNNMTMTKPHATGQVDDELLKFIVALQKGEFYGLVELHFSKGQVMRVRKQETFLGKDLSRLTAD